MELKNVESTIPLSNFKSWLIQVTAMWPQASHWQSEAGGRRSREVRCQDAGALESVHGCLETGPVSDMQSGLRRCLLNKGNDRKKWTEWGEREGGRARIRIFDSVTVSDSSLEVWLLAPPLHQTSPAKTLHITDSKAHSSAGPSCCSPFPVFLTFSK